MNYDGIDCTHCGAENMAPIIYGYPTTDMIDLARQDIIALGGCVVSEDNPSHYCYKCNEVV